MGPHSSTLDWRIPWTEGPGGLKVHGGHKESDTTEQIKLSLLLLIQQGLKDKLFVSYFSSHWFFALILFMIQFLFIRKFVSCNTLFCLFSGCF